jgi:hypothetical protein
MYLSNKKSERAESKAETELNGAMDDRNAAWVGMRPQQWLAQNGLEGSAEVLSIADTGTLFNQDPVVMLTVKIQPAMIAVAFETTGIVKVSKDAMPRAGEKIKIRYNPANPTQFIVL